MTYLTEFPEFDFVIPKLPDGFVDVSWHNNVCPSFEKMLNDEFSITIWINYSDASKRECGGSQFLVMVHVLEELENVLYESQFDLWDDALNAINDILANEATQ